jgi:hypothetical protein
VDFKLAFPHLCGLTASGKPADDYYFFPWGGGIIGDRAAYIRRGYGDHQALYQVTDVFSPGRGGGLYLRADDPDGWHKTLALRKHIPGQPEEDGQRNYLATAEEYKWKDPLPAVEGIGVAYEYLRRTRPAGGEFRPADAVLAAHPGDWHQAMGAYAAWAHRVWRFRPWPSRLKTVHAMIAAGWDGDALLRDGRYRTDFMAPETDCIELMSWWDWSPRGPWRAPFDDLASVLSPDQIRGWQPYFVKDPVSGQMMFNNQPGDYDGYNERFGGLAAFRAAIAEYKRMGAMVTLYTDPIRCDDNTKTGQRWGKVFGVAGPDGKPVTSYDQWTPCHDVAEYRRWVADTMGRVMRETGADGIRLDEYGHAGWACFSKLHAHSFAEPGCSQWGKCIAETTRLVRRAMDEVDPRSVLTTEHPGYDYLFPAIEGCINYDLTVQATPLRPLECNAQRFFFPECKPYELEYSNRPVVWNRKFWNAVESFGGYWPAAMLAALKENEDVYQSRDCTPLVPTLRACVYANRFAGGGKVIHHLYNASGHTVDGPVLAADVRAGEHLFDLLGCREIVPEVAGGHGAVRLYMAADDVACIARLRNAISLRRDGAAVIVKALRPATGCVVALCDAEGKRLVTVAAKGSETRLDMAGLAAGAKPACAKLLRAGQLVDVAALP